MISVSLIVAVLSFAVSFLVFRKKKMAVRVLCGVLLTSALVVVFLAMFVIGGDPAQPGSVTYTEGK